MTTAVNTTGTLLSEAGRQPLAGAKVYVKRTVNQNSPNRSYGISWGKQFATTDERGQYTLDQLTRDTNSLAVFESADGARTIAHNLVAGEHVEVLMPPRRDLVINFTGDFERLSKVQGKVKVTICPA